MKRREFIQFMGVSAAATTASVALANIPETESQIILLNKPKKIIQAKTIPDVDFIISEGLINIAYSYERPVARFTGIVDVELKVWAFNENNRLMEVNAFDTFTFDLSEDCFSPSKSKRYDIVCQLNGRKFKIIRHMVNMSAGTPISVSIRAEEIMNS